MASRGRMEPGEARARLSKMSRFRRTAVALAVTGLVLSVISCTGNDPAPPAAASPPGASEPPENPATTAPPAPGATGTGPPASPALRHNVMLRRSGGFAGVQEGVVVDPDGDWTVVDRRRGGAARRGRLDRADLERLRDLLTKPALAEEAKVRLPPPACADGFVYVLGFGDLTVAWNACGRGDVPETAGAIADLIESRTAF